MSVCEAEHEMAGLPDVGGHVEGSVAPAAMVQKFGPDAGGDARELCEAEIAAYEAAGCPA